MLFPGKLRLTQGHNKHLLSNNLILACIIFKLIQLYQDHWKWSKLLKSYRHRQLNAPVECCFQVTTNNSDDFSLA